MQPYSETAKLAIKGFRKQNRNKIYARKQKVLRIIQKDLQDKLLVLLEETLHEQQKYVHQLERTSVALIETVVTLQGRRNEFFDNPQRIHSTPLLRLAEKAINYPVDMRT